MVVGAVPKSREPITVHHLLSREHSSPACLPSRLCPLLPSIADCASVHEASIAGLAPPLNSRRKGSKFCHRRATISPSLRPLSRLHCALLRATVTPPLLHPGFTLFRASVAPFVVPPSPHFATVPHSYHLATNVALLLRATAPASILRLFHHFQPPSHHQFSPG
ncbi:hypothetical protein DEO72_LG6g733 [Vigna unguiculata]|uniref:Uncharacterized protein n=1 Tax=Vigna unguiculata TaxID=3917 RepID=A0A4D6M6I2_VIGUN|nr:hypothetical protein DEO72_LG6g733 [Vigna unguiculata]